MRDLARGAFTHAPPPLDQSGSTPSPRCRTENGTKRFSGMTVCGEGDRVKTFLLPGQHAKGQRVS